MGAYGKWPIRAGERLRDAAPVPQTPAVIREQRRRRLQAEADAHAEWEREYAGHPMDPDKAAARPDGSDYNQQHLDVDPPEGAEDRYQEIRRRHLRAAGPSEG